MNKNPGKNDTFHQFPKFHKFTANFIIIKLFYCHNTPRPHYILDSSYEFRKSVPIFYFIYMLY